MTYPTYNLRELAKDVVLRLAKKNDKAVHQLELTYGGGKTHALITLLHLVQDPQHLPSLPAVQEFCEHIGMTPPQARIGVLAFDKLDVEKGMEVLGYDGERKWLKHPSQRNSERGRTLSSGDRTGGVCYVFTLTTCRSKGVDHEKNIEHRFSNPLDYGIEDKRQLF